MSVISINVEIVLGVLALFLNSYLGIIMFWQNKKSWTNKFFALLAFLINIYIVVNFISLHPIPNTPESQLFWIRMVMFICSFIGPAVFLLVYTFPKEKFFLKKKYAWSLFALFLFSSFSSITNLVFKSITYPEGQPIPIPGIGIPFFFLDFIGLFILSFIILIIKYFKSVGKDKKQIFWFLAGIVITFSIMGITTVISVVIFKTSATVFLGPLASVILMIFIAYAIIKYELFNLKVIGTQLLVGLLAGVLISKLVFFESISSLIIDLVVFFIVLFFGYLLVGSVKKEVQQKEELAVLAHNLEKANLRLQELDQQKTEFLSIASHQLRTPLSIIRGYIELIGDGAYGKVSKGLRETLGNMDESNDRLMKLVEEFLDITRIEQGRTKFVFAENSLNDTITSVVKELSMKSEVEEKKLKISWKPEKNIDKIIMDEEKIRHVVFNFLDNAIKYSDKGTIKISLETEDNGYTVRVKDQGFGFNKEDEVNFFQKFYRGKNVEGTNVNGTGLGIYVCRKFIEKHGGHVWAHSEGLGKGSEFGFWVPGVQVNDL